MSNLRQDLTNMLKPISLALLVILCSVSFVADAEAQTRRTSKITKAKPTPTPKPFVTGAEIISQAGDQTELELIGTPMRVTNEVSTASPTASTDQTLLITQLQERIKQLESDIKGDPDAVQKRLLLHLDILTRAEQRVESLRKQGFEMIEKENDIQKRLDAIEIDIKPEMIERNTAMAGSLRPEEVRESRRKQLESERNNLQTLLLEVQRNRATLDNGIRRADDLVERLRTKLEKDIDSALADDPVTDL